MTSYVTYDQYTGGGLTKLGTISSPYSSSIDVDSEFEDGSLQANALSAGSITAQTTVGDRAGGFILIDGLHRRIIVNDGKNDRILIGYQANGFN